MFTGIVQRQISITNQEQINDVVTVSFSGVRDWNLAVGDSLLVNGICSTITEINEDICTVQYMPQTLRLTTVKQWQLQQLCNAESSLTLATPLSGWLVTGHVDTIGTVAQTAMAGTDVQLTISFDTQFDHLVLVQGTITIDGVNLTVTDAQPGRCSVHIIPFTMTHTTLQSLKVGSIVNIEFDYFAKLTAKQLQRS